MKRILSLIAVFVISAGTSLFSQLNITTVDKISTNDEMFIGMAVTAAKKAVVDGGKAGGAVVILNGAWRSTGIETDGKAPEIVAFEKSRRPNLEHAIVYTVNEPATATINALNNAGVQAIYFVNPRQNVVAAGIYSASDYDDSKLDTGVSLAPLYMLLYPEGQELLAK